MSSLQWIIIAIICGAIEIFSAGFWFIWLAISALIVAIGSQDFSAAFFRKSIARFRTSYPVIHHIGSSSNYEIC